MSTRYQQDILKKKKYIYIYIYIRNLRYQQDIAKKKKNQKSNPKDKKKYLIHIYTLRQDRTGWTIFLFSRTMMLNFTAVLLSIGA